MNNETTPAATNDELNDTEGHSVGTNHVEPARAEEDTEGHSFRGIVAPEGAEDDTEGHNIKVHP